MAKLGCKKLSISLAIILVSNDLTGEKFKSRTWVFIKSHWYNLHTFFLKSVNKYTDTYWTFISPLEQLIACLTGCVYTDSLVTLHVMYVTCNLRMRPSLAHMLVSSWSHVVSSKPPSHFSHSDIAEKQVRHVFYMWHLFQSNLNIPILIMTADV